MVPVGILGILGCAAQAQRSARSAEVPTVNQSVSQLFHGPAPRSPIPQLTVQLRRCELPTIQSVTNLNRGQDTPHTRDSVSLQSVNYFTIPPRAHPSTGSQSCSAAPVLEHKYRVLAPGG